MTFTNLDLSKKLHALGCKSVSGQFYSEHEIIHRHSPYEECQDQKHEEIFGIPKYCLEDFALNNDHCWENRLRLKVASAIRYSLIDSEDWTKYLEDLLKD